VFSKNQLKMIKVFRILRKEHNNNNNNRRLIMNKMQCMKMKKRYRKGCSQLLRKLELNEKLII